MRGARRAWPEVKPCGYIYLLCILYMIYIIHTWPEVEPCGPRDTFPRSLRRARYVERSCFGTHRSGSGGGPGWSGSKPIG